MVNKNTCVGSYVHATLCQVSSTKLSLTTYFISTCTKIHGEEYLLSEVDLFFSDAGVLYLFGSSKCGRILNASKVKHRNTGPILSHIKSTASVTPPQNTIRNNTWDPRGPAKGMISEMFATRGNIEDGDQKRQKLWSPPSHAHTSGARYTP